ncbi:unnamed protein product [Amoebophrya sp. A25]|nr:unnamed protein product [Amoebophrya sp. A25]|eukprot:GSA25T00025054001.1
MVLLGQAAWVFRALFYAYMPSADYVLLVEPLHGITFALVWTAAVHEVGKMAPPSMKSSAQGVLQLTFQGVGPFLAVYIGGILFDSIGYRACFILYAALCGLSLCAYIALPEAHVGEAGFGAHSLEDSASPRVIGAYEVPTTYNAEDQLEPGSPGSPVGGRE